VTITLSTVSNILSKLVLLLREGACAASDVGDPSSRRRTLMQSADESQANRGSWAGEKGWQ